MRKLWNRLTTYTVPIYVSYGVVARHRTSTVVHRWRQPRAPWFASVSIRCEDADWQEIEGEVTEHHDVRGRLLFLSVYFDIPCDTTPGAAEFFIDNGTVGEIQGVTP